MKKMLFVMNPSAGTRQGKRYLSEILTMFCHSNYEVQTFITTAPGEATDVVARYAGQVDVVVCCGGDGTFNETISGMMQSGYDTPIGYIPAGSTNDFASSLRLSLQPEDAAYDILRSRPIRQDVGRFGNRFFSYVASFGAFTRVSYATPQSIKNTLGHTAYLLEGIQELAQIRPIHMKLELDGTDIIEDDFIFGAICNSTSVGGILTLDPNQVDMRDGKFEIFLVRAPKKLIEIPECIQALQTQKYNCHMITFRPASAIRVTTDPGVVWTLDGERAEGAEVIDIKNCHQAIQLMLKG